MKKSTFPTDGIVTFSFLLSLILSIIVLIKVELKYKLYIWQEKNALIATSLIIITFIFFYIIILLIGCISQNKSADFLKRLFPYFLIALLAFIIDLIFYLLNTNTTYLSIVGKTSTPGILVGLIIVMIYSVRSGKPL